MKYTITNNDEYDMKLTVRTGPDRSSDADPMDNGLEDTVIPVGRSYTFDDEHVLVRLSLLTPTKDTVDMLYIGGGD